MNRRYPTQLAWAMIVLCVVFVVVLSFIGGETAVRVENYVGMALSIAAFIQYRHDAWDALVRNRPTGYQILALGIFINWMRNNIQSIYSSLVRDFNLDWELGDVVVAFFLFLMVLSGLLHVVGPTLDEEGFIPKRAYIRIGIVVTLGIIAAIAVTGVRWYFGMEYH